MYWTKEDYNGNSYIIAPTFLAFVIGVMFDHICTTPAYLTYLNRHTNSGRINVNRLQ